MKLNDNIEITNEDNMILMSRYQDNYFDLAVVDPPYGINESGQNNKTRSVLTSAKDYGNKKWDKSPPSKLYFKQLIRISKYQIIFGANHFISKIPYDSSCWIVWNKDNGKNDFADCELAWTSFKTAVRNFKWKWHGMLQQNMKNKQKRIHPTEKPIQLYEWIFKNYAKENNKILDTHLGSGSIAIALDKVNKYDKMNLSLIACELDEDYYKGAIKRIKQELMIKSLFK